MKNKCNFTWLIHGMAPFLFYLLSPLPPHIPFFLLPPIKIDPPKIRERKKEKLSQTQYYFCTPSFPSPPPSPFPPLSLPFLSPFPHPSPPPLLLGSHLFNTQGLIPLFHKDLSEFITHEEVIRGGGEGKGERGGGEGEDLFLVKYLL